MSSSNAARVVAAHLGPESVLGVAHLPKGRIKRTGIAVLDESRKSPVRLGDVIEVVGGSCAGKTQLLHVIAAHALAERELESSPKVCWFDLNGSLDQARLHQLLQIADRGHQRRVRDQSSGTPLIPGLQVYYPENTSALCAALQKLPEFLKSSAGAAVDTIIVDGIGSSHYLDKYEANRARGTSRTEIRPLSNELILTRIVSDVLQHRRAVVFVSKCSLFGEETLSASWPFPEAGIPRIPADFMPAVWRSIVSHTLLIYKVQQKNEEYETSLYRAVVSLAPKPMSSFQSFSVCAAGTIIITKEGVDEVGELHVV